ncbi:Phosphotransferase enzyme family protein [Alkalithermobacter thermoalcaliphilus JW-YL-7 = DSM 7308]|uniref:Aminoglycoside phosphotransferase n=1 Tax=Alkalithermobacter thermoalcaliphilus JW-YL-7 = DSM 7308 TaxID=1121328 RepID=A0A150FQS7_CLOPD|nr:aminoglycoside phosphotransferase [[Clostridium] paradoxum JW-YL-7 = DSM 7308]SHK77050.1 Phosphotransferase enzyme family protein [[Clostridium] paradoxum JW-YL-7 = DSM 7308]
MLKDILSSQIKHYIKDKNINNYINLQSNFNVEFLAQGEYNVNFLIYDKYNKYVFRVNTKSQLQIENQIKYEYDALKKLEISKVTPKVYYLDDTKSYINYGILIMEYLKGRPLDYSKDLNKAAKIFSKIHSIDTNNGNYSNFIKEENILSDRIKEAKRLLKIYFDSDIVNTEQKKFFYNFIQWAEKNRYKENYFKDNVWMVINNTEVNSHNFIIGDENSFLIDWEKPVISDPCQDITQFLAPTTTLWKANYILSKEEKEMFFKVYKDYLNEDKQIEERVHIYTPYLYLRALSWCAYAFIEYQDPNKDIKNMDTFKKIKEYLDINFMNNLLKDYI